MKFTRRDFLAIGAAGSIPIPWTLSAGEDEKKDNSLDGEVGITTASVGYHLTAQPKSGKFTLLDLPRILRDELDMRVIDLNTSSLPSLEPDYLDRFRKAAEKAGSVLTNLKMNQRGLNLGSPDRAVREKAVKQYKRSIDAAARLGMQWVRPLPRKDPPDRESLVAGLRELADYAAAHRVQLLIENYGWMEADPESAVRLADAVGKNVAVCPDTGNWSSNDVRYRGLAETFPLAVTCDFKARDLGPNGEHKLYDLKRCFTIGWEAGFRGPWCLEHANRDRAQLFRELALLRDSLRTWMSERSPG